MAGCGDVLSLEDLQTAKKHQIFEAEVITGKAGGVAGGAAIDYAVNPVTGQIQKTMPAILRDIGFEPASFDFTSGGTLTTSDRNKAVLWPIASGGDGDWYYWEGALPKVIPAASTPASTGGVEEGAWRPVGDITLRGDLASPVGVSRLGEFDSVSAMRAAIGKSGDKAVLASYNSGWAVSSKPPVGGGKFRWAEDNTLVDDGVFIFKPAGATGAWVRQYQKKVTPYLAGAKGDNIDDTAAMLRCFAVAKDRRLNVHLDKGQYKYTQTPEVGAECSVTGEFSVAELLPVGCDGFKFTSSDAVGGRKFGGFVLLGTGANQAGYTAIAVDPGQDVIKRTTGVSFEDIQIFNFKTAVNAKNLWHSTFRSVNATNVCNGVIFRGRCVSNEVGSGTKIVRGNGALVSGECIGVQFLESNDYTPAAPARPEGCHITTGVLIFGFDVNVDVDSMLAGSILGADLDFGRSRGVRYRFWDGKAVCAPNWIAGDAAYSAQPFIGVEAVPVISQRPFGPHIKDITMTTFNGNAGDVAIKLGSLNGRADISGCLISQSVGIGIYDNGARFNRFKNNDISSPIPLFMFSTGGNQIDGNSFVGGVITDSNPIGRNQWGKNAGEVCTGDTVAVPIAAGATSGTLLLSSIGYTRGVPVAVGAVSLTCTSVGAANPGNTWADISSDGMTITAYKTTAFGSASSLYVTVSIA